MTSISQNIQKPALSGEFQVTKSVHKGGYLLIALGVIALIGSLVAAGYISAHLAIPTAIGVGMTISILCCFVAKYHCVNTTRIPLPLGKSEKIEVKAPQAESEAEIKNDSTKIVRSPRVQSRPRRAQSNPEQRSHIVLPRQKLQTPIDDDFYEKCPHFTEGEWRQLKPRVKELDFDKIFSNILDEDQKKKIVNVIFNSPFGIGKCINDLDKPQLAIVSPYLPQTASVQPINTTVSVNSAPRRNILEWEPKAADLISTKKRRPELLDIPLKLWFKEVSNLSDIDQSYLRQIEDPNNKRYVKSINRYLEKLEKEIHLKERLEELNYPNVLVKDLLPQLEFSSKASVMVAKAHLMLMLDDELSALTLSSVEHINQTLLYQVLGNRVRSLGTQKSDANLSKLSLIDLTKLKAEHIHAGPEIFPPVAFFLMNLSELQRVDLDRLSSKQLHFIFSIRDKDEKGEFFNYVTRLKAEKLNSCIKLISKREVLAKLDNNQIPALDFSQVFKDVSLVNQKKIVDGIFSGKVIFEIKEILQSLSNDNFSLICPHLEDLHWHNLGKRVLTLDFAQIFTRITNKEKREKIVTAIFCNAGLDMALLKSLDKPQRKIITEHLPKAAKHTRK